MEGTYCRALAGTTMHLIINSLDTRRWMSDGGFAGGWWPGKGCKAGGGDGWFVARARDEGKEDRRGMGDGEENGGLEESGWGG